MNFSHREEEKKLFITIGLNRKRWQKLDYLTGVAIVFLVAYSETVAFTDVARSLGADQFFEVADVRDRQPKSLNL